MDQLGCFRFRISGHARVGRTTYTWPCFPLSAGRRTPFVQAAGSRARVCAVCVCGSAGRCVGGWGGTGGYNSTVVSIVGNETLAISVGYSGDPTTVYSGVLGLNWVVAPGGAGTSYVRVGVMGSCFLLSSDPHGPHLGSHSRVPPHLGMCACACVCMCACVPVCARVCMCVPVCARTANTTLRRIYCSALRHPCPWAWLHVVTRGGSTSAPWQRAAWCLWVECVSAASWCVPVLILVSRAPCQRHQR